jgi:hypothetical protein
MNIDPQVEAVEIPQEADHPEEAHLMTPMMEIHTIPTTTMEKTMMDILTEIHHAILVETQIVSNVCR